MIFDYKKCIWLIFPGLIACLNDKDTISDTQYLESLATQANLGESSVIVTILELWPIHESKFWAKLDCTAAFELLRVKLNFDSEELPGELVSLGEYLVPSLTIDDFQAMRPDTCSIFAECIEWISDFSIIPKDCQRVLLDSGVVSIEGIKRMPFDWLMMASNQFLARLTGEHLNSVSLRVFSNWAVSGRCSEFDSVALSKLKRNRWLKLIPNCVRMIPNLRLTIIPRKVLSLLPPKTFSKYNERLHKKTINAMTPAQARAYASKIPKWDSPCRNFEIKFLSLEAAVAITPDCLEEYIFSNRFQVPPMRGSWTALARPFKKFTKDMMSVVGYIHSEDFGWMPKSVIDKIFTSTAALDSLIKSEVNIPRIAELVKLEPTHFKFLIDYSGKLANTFLENAKVLPDTVFAYFEAKDYQKLSSITTDGRNLIGEEFIISLEHHKNFPLIVNNLSSKAASHYCATVLTQDDYIKKIWLREHATESCWKSLPFPMDDSIRSRAPELNRGKLNWDNFVLKGRKFFRLLPLNVLMDLVKMQSFCKPFASIAEPDFLNSSQSCGSLLGAITPQCAMHLYKFITSKDAPKLVDDAFEMFNAKTFNRNFKLSDLRPVQISSVSKRHPKNSKSHVFNTVTPQEILTLNREQLSAITLEQFEIYSKKFDKDPMHTSVLVNRSVALKDREMLLEALSQCESLLKNLGHSKCHCIEMLELQLASPSVVPKYFLKFIRSSLKDYDRIGIALAKNPYNLLEKIRKRNSPSNNSVELILAHDPLEGFDRAESLAILRNHPADFSHSGMKIINPNFTDYDGPQRSWIEQMLIDIMDNVTQDAGKNDLRYRKFSWLISRDAGKLAGLLFGKALQKNVLIPFKLEDAFWALFLEPTKVNIETYYKATYKDEIWDYYSRNLQQDPSHQFDATIIPYIRPDALTFTTLDVKSNIYTPTDDQILDYQSLNLLTRENIGERYFSELDKVIRAEFEAFILNFMNGLGETLLVSHFSFIRHLPNFVRLFKSLPMSREKVVNTLLFDQSLETTMVPSLIPGHEISVANVVRSYVQALTPIQLRKFIKICTGASLLPSNKHIQISEYSAEGQEERAYGYFWTDPKTKNPINILVEKREPHITIAAGSEYKTLVRNVAGIQNGMLNLIATAPDPFNPEIGTAHDGESKGSVASTCFNKLTIHPQPAGALIHSLTVLINMSVADFVDE